VRCVPSPKSWRPHRCLRLRSRSCTTRQRVFERPRRLRHAST
jgi:hypothetical protein